MLRGRGCWGDTREVDAFHKALHFKVSCRKVALLKGCASFHVLILGSLTGLILYSRPLDTFSLIKEGRSHLSKKNGLRRHRTLPCEGPKPSGLYD